jgi:hypothetical protein
MARDKEERRIKKEVKVKKFSQEQMAKWIAGCERGISLVPPTGSEYEII